MRGKQVFHILHGDLFLRLHAPGNVVGNGRITRVRPVPLTGMGIQIPLHEPGAGRVVHMIRVVMAAEGIPGIQNAVLRQVQVMGVDELLQIRGAHVRFLRAKGVLQVEAVDAELIGHYHVGLVRHPSGHPVMAADGLQPPDLVRILKGDAVHLIGAVLLQQASQPLHALSRAAYVGKHQTDDVLLPDAAGRLLLSILRRLIDHQRVSSEHPGIGGDRLRGRHPNARLVDAAGGPDSLSLQGVRHRGIAHGIFGKLHFHMGDHRLIHLRLIFRLYHHEFLRGKMSRARIIVSRDHRRSVTGRFFSYQYCCTGHRFLHSGSSAKPVFC